MNLLDKLEKKFGRFAVKGLMIYIVGLNALVFMLGFVDPLIEYKLMLIPQLVVQNKEIWRIFTYIFIPPDTTVIFFIFVLYFYYMIGTTLESEWGSFKFNIYYFAGMLGTTIACFITGVQGTPSFINLSLFLAFARLYPNYEILLFFVLPVKVKYLGWIYWASIIYTILFKPLPLKVAAIVSLINYFLFFGREMFSGAKNSARVFENKRNFRREVRVDGPMHRCTICGITEKDDPDMEFRYCVDCDGDYEYCMKHLKNHKHIKKPEKNNEE